MYTCTYTLNTRLHLLTDKGCDFALQFFVTQLHLLNVGNPLCSIPSSLVLFLEETVCPPKIAGRVFRPVLFDTALTYARFRRTVRRRLPRECFIGVTILEIYLIKVNVDQC